MRAKSEDMLERHEDGLRTRFGSTSCGTLSSANMWGVSEFMKLQRAAFSYLGATSRNNLVDPASSHMLVSKIKPCKSKYKLLYGETANSSLQQL